MYRCTHAVQMYVHLCVYTCGDQSSLDSSWIMLILGVTCLPISFCVSLEPEIHPLCSLPSKPHVSTSDLWDYRRVKSMHHLLSFSFFFFFFQCPSLSSEDWTRAFILARQSFQQLSYLASPSSAEVVLLRWISCSAGSIIILITPIRWQEFKTYTQLQLM